MTSSERCPGPCEMEEGCLCWMYCEHGDFVESCLECNPPCDVCGQQLGCACCERCGAYNPEDCHCDPEVQEVLMREWEADHPPHPEHPILQLMEME